MIATMSRPLRSAAVTFHAAARSVFCRPASVARSASVSARPHCSRERLLQAAKIARRIVHVRLGDLDVIEADDRIDLDRMRLGALAHNLTVDLAFRRHVDDEIAADPGLAAEPPRRREAARACRRSGSRPRPRASHDRRSSESRAWRTRPRRYRPGSGRKCPVRRRPNRDRRQASRAAASRLVPVGELAALAGGREDDAMRAQSASASNSGAAAPFAPRRPRPPRPPAPARDICGSRRRNWDRGP